MSVIVSKKVCSRCGLDYVHKWTSRGARCGSCRAAYRAEHYLKNRGHTLSVNRAWALRNPENAKERSARWHEENKEHHAELNAAWYEGNKEAHLEKGRERYLRNKELRMAQIKDWRRLNPDRINAALERYARRYPERRKETQRKWRQRNPAHVRAAAMRRYDAKRRATPPWLTPEHRAQILAFYVAAVELEKLTGVKHHVDHIFPLRGRRSCGLHVPWNLQVLPAAANLRKSNREP